LPEAIDTELASAGQLRVVSGSAVAQMQQWLTPPPGVGLGRKQLDEVGRTLGCDLILTGTFTAAGGILHVETQLEDIASGRTVATFSVSDKEERLLDLVASASRELRATLGLAPPDGGRERARTSLSSNPEALRFYFLGLDALRVNDAARSAELLTQAATDDPDFALAHSTLSLAWRVLGYDEKSQDEARRAFELSGQLSREDKLSVEGTYYQVMSEFPKAIDRFQSLWSSYPDDISYALKLVHAEMMGGRMDEARRVIDQMKVLPPPADRDPRVDVVEAAWLARKGRLDEALAADARAAGKAAKAKSTELLAAIKLNEGGVHRQLGTFDEAMRDFDEARRLFEMVGEPAGSGDALRGIARVLLDQDRPEDAARRLEQAAAIATGAHAQRLLVLTQIAQSEVSRRLGRLADAIVEANAAVATARATRSRSPLALALTALGVAELDRHEPAMARAHLEEAERLGHEINEPPVFASAAGHLARLDLAEGRTADARRRLDEILPIVRRSGDKAALARLETLAATTSAPD
jgi:tetratricopeptide (TPR) repeat protein